MDAYLALTPLLVLGIIGLVRFIGCNWFWGLEPTVAEVKPVDALQAVAADRRVTLSWTYLSTENITGFRVDVAGGDADPVAPLIATDRTAIVTGLTNGTLYTFSVIAERAPYASVPVSKTATPGVTSFVTDEPAITGSARNDYTGFSGMEIMVGPAPIIVTQLGRIVATTNSGVHEVKIVRPVTTPLPGVPVTGVDEVSVSVTTVAEVSQANVGRFAWTPLPQPFMMQPNTIYFIVSSEIDGGDLFYQEQFVPTTAVAALLSSIFTFATGPDVGKYGRNSPGLVYGPVSFRY
jgi:hypothetical protein